MKELYSIGIVPVVKIDDPTTALPLAKAMWDGGIPCMEITFRTAHAKAAITEIKEAYPKMIVGAGTVITKQQVDESIEAGADFIVSPGMNQTIASYVLSKNIPFYPGCASASDIESALELGINAVKFFPAESSGGLKKIKDLAAPYGDVTFMPTGGINESNIAEYLMFEKIIACGGTFMIPKRLVQEQRYDEITMLCKNAIRTALGIEMRHVGMNTTSAHEIASQISKLTMEPLLENEAGIFVGKEFEVLKQPYLGTHGHIAIAVNDIHRAISYYEMMGHKLDMNTKKYKDDKLVAVYFKEEIGGFSFHLLQK